MADDVADAAPEGDAPSANKPQPRRKPAKATAKADVLSAAGAAGLAELSGLQHLMDKLVQGLSAMQEAQATQTEMLSALMRAVTLPLEPESSIATTLRHISLQLGHQIAQATEMKVALTSLPGEVAAAVGKEMTAALDAVR